jgi:hypothetical protein
MIRFVVTNCQTGAPIRDAPSLQQFRPDGSMVETVNTALRGISEGVQGHSDDRTFPTSYWFYRHRPDGTFASRATVTDKIVLCSNGRFTSSGVVIDYDANGNFLDTGCFTHTATRLTTGLVPYGDNWNR